MQTTERPPTGPTRPSPVRGVVLVAVAAVLGFFLLRAIDDSGSGIAVVGGLPAALSRLTDAGVHVVGLDGAARTSLYDMAGADGPVCLVLGAEGRGLSRLVRERCDEVVAIPLLGHLASLNVSAAAALACFEIARKRS